MPTKVQIPEAQPQPARTRIKVCGVRDAKTALASVQAGADAIGLVFVAASPRAVSVARARKIVAGLPVFVEPVGLFVNAPLRTVVATAKALGLRTVQLHGDESPDYVARLAPLRVIKAVNLAQVTAEDLAAWRKAGDNLAGLIWDADAPKAAKRKGLTGGHGQRPDGQALALLTQSLHLTGLPPAILAGGLNPENVATAVALIRPYGVDVSSGVESRRGVKDPALIAAYCAAVRAADQFSMPARPAQCCGRHAHCEHHQHA
jgi:phosphoribosylanthranilate isomerase